MPVPIRASVAAMASDVPPCHTKQKAWQPENGNCVFARGEAVCDLMIDYANVFSAGVKLAKVRSLKESGKPLKS